MAPFPGTPGDPQDLLSEVAGTQGSGPPPLSPLVLPTLASVSPLYHQLCVCLSISSPPWGALLPRSQALQGSLTLLKVGGKGILDEGSFVSVCLPSHASLPPSSISASLFLPTLSGVLCLCVSLQLSFSLSLSVSPSPSAPAPSLGTSVSPPLCPRLSLPIPRCPWISAFLSLSLAPPSLCPAFS